MDALFRRIAEAQDGAISRASGPVEIGRTVRRRRASSPVRLAFATALAGASVVAAVFLFRAHRPLAFEVGAGQSGTPGTSLVALAESTLPLRFSDGSTVAFQAGSRGRVQRLGDDGAEMVLEAGRLDASIQHAERTRWLFLAGPYRIRVTGTRFSAEWTPAGGAFAVVMKEGSVLVSGPGLDPNGVSLVAGKSLRIGGGVAAPRGAVGAAPAAASAVAASGPGASGLGAEQGTSERSPPSPGAAPAVSESAAEPGARWESLADRGEHAAALRAAERAGFSRLCATLDARALLALGDAARFAAAGRRAEQAFRALVERFPRAAVAPDAVFSLGRLAFEQGRPDEAAAWFGRYLDRWPRAPLIEQARGRLFEAHGRAGDSRAARAAAESYLALHPAGAYAAEARRVLEASPAP